MMKTIAYLGVLLVTTLVGCGGIGSRGPAVTIRNDSGYPAPIVFSRVLHDTGSGGASETIDENHNVPAGGSFTISVVESDPPDTIYRFDGKPISGSIRGMTFLLRKDGIPIEGRTYSYTGNAFVIAK